MHVITSFPAAPPDIRGQDSTASKRPPDSEHGRRAYLFLPIVGCWFLAGLSVMGQQVPAEFTFPVSLPIECHGDVEYFGEDGALIVHSRDGERANVVYGERSITADEIVVDFVSQQIRAHGNVRLWDRGRLMVADQVLYDLEKEEARLYNLKHATLDPQIYLTGDNVLRQRVAGDTPAGATEPERVDQYTITDGTVTTCDLPIPHYYIRYDSMTIIPGDRFWLHDIWWLQGGLPLGYMPFFTRSLAEHRIAYIFYGGHMSDLGVATLHKLNVHLDPRLRLAFMGDTFSKVGYGYGASWRFHFPGQYGPDGRIRWYGVSQRGADDDRFFEDEDRYRIAGSYRQTLPHGIKVTSEFHRSSDFDFNEDYDRVMKQRGDTSYDMERNDPSFISVSKAWDQHTARITTAKYLEDFFFSQLPRTERLPQAKWDLMPTNLFNTNLYLDAHVAYDDVRREQGYHPRRSRDETTNYIDEIQRTDAELELFYPLNLPYGWFLLPHVGYRGTDYSDPSRRRVAGLPDREFDDEFRSLLEAGTELGTRSIAYWDAGERWGKLRWVFEPTIGYDYYQPSVDLEEIGREEGLRFPYIDDVDEFRATFHRVSARLSTRLQSRGKEGVRTLGRLTMGGAYDIFPDDNLRFDNLVYMDDLADSDDHRYTDYFEELRISPLRWMSFGNYLRYDVDDSTIRTSNTYLELHPAARWGARIGFNSFDDPFIDEEEQEEIYLSTRYQLSHKWSVLLAHRYDVDDSTSRKNSVTFVRNLHDFQALIELEQRNRQDRDDEFSVMFALRFIGLGGKYSMF